MWVSSETEQKCLDCNNCQFLGDVAYVFVNLVQARFTWEDGPPLWNCLLQIYLWASLWSIFLFNDGFELPLGPGLYTKANKHTSKQYSSVVSASVHESSPQTSLCDEL